MDEEETPEESQDALPEIHVDDDSPARRRSPGWLLLAFGGGGIALGVGLSLLFYWATRPGEVNPPEAKPTPEELFRQIAERVEADLRKVAAGKEEGVYEFKCEVLEEFLGVQHEKYPLLGVINIEWGIPNDDADPETGYPASIHHATATYRYCEPEEVWMYHDYLEHFWPGGWALQEDEVVRVFKNDLVKAEKFRYGRCHFKHFPETEELLKIGNRRSTAHVFKHTGAPLIWDVQVVRRLEGEEGTVLASASTRTGVLDLCPRSDEQLTYPGFEGTAVITVPANPTRLAVRCSYRLDGVKGQSYHKTEFLPLPNLADEVVSANSVNFVGDQVGWGSRSIGWGLACGETRTKTISYKYRRLSADTSEGGTEYIEVVLTMTCLTLEDWVELRETKYHTLIAGCREG